MKFTYGKQDFQNFQQAQDTSWLIPNGLGGYCAGSAAFSVSRVDQGILIAADTAPSERTVLVQRLSETLELDGEQLFLSTQEFDEKRLPEDGFRHLSQFVWENGPRWRYDVGGVTVIRRCGMGRHDNTAAVFYEITNGSDREITLRVTPKFLCRPKGKTWSRPVKAVWDAEAVACGGKKVYAASSTCWVSRDAAWEKLYFRHDIVDGRRKHGLCVSLVETTVTVAPGKTETLMLQFADHPISGDGQQVLHSFEARQKEIAARVRLRAPEAAQLACSADAYITRRDSTGGKTIVAGYPFFGDWGRDTMISLPGCVLSIGDYETAKSILRTFLAYEKDGLVPNLFPEGNEPPRYNTVDAALLLINCLWLYHEKTGDLDFIREAYPVLERIISAYTKGTIHGIGMDDDGLIHAGQGLDQVTWMDVCVDGILPTPRHGKPVEINAYWYNALKIMEAFSAQIGRDGTGFAAMAEKVKGSFLEKFWMEDRGYLKDVLSGTPADNQIRCNQIWAVTMPFTMLTPEMERRVVQTVYRELYTTCGLRTLSTRDPEFHGTYGGPMKQRDLAYHQGTVWVFPLGAFYRAYLKVGGNTKAAAAQVRDMLGSMQSMLREGCVGQLPEIYDGLTPGQSRGCFAQAWSVGEMLTVYELLEQIEQEEQ